MRTNPADAAKRAAGTRELGTVIAVLAVLSLVALAIGYLFG